MSRFSATVSVGKTCRPSGHLAEAKIADAVTGPARNVGAAEGDSAARLRLHAGERADERRLAGAVGADNGDDRAFLDIKRHRIERLHVAVEHIEVFDAQHHSASAPR